MVIVGSAFLAFCSAVGLALILHANGVIAYTGAVLISSIAYLVCVLAALYAIFEACNDDPILPMMAVGAAVAGGIAVVPELAPPA